ncbi:MAG: 30S ribosomal protein S17 [Aigarchaeota archaeon]|nr:30S ribosomal protein S17 [Aigarchaeota archaeon]MCX8193134.1 30S ribosomal protein S17 [Nitrososphaeria archaeon]MDW7986757.1 30S ribosomal protein S17 [Nitrososphaerota archaeon]
MTITTKNIGVPVRPPARECSDPDCPFHGYLKIRGIILTGTVYKKKMNKTVVVRREYLYYLRKYKRYERRRSNIPAHLPECIDVNEGDKVKIAECRPLSKTVSFVVIEKLE